MACRLGAAAMDQSEIDALASNLESHGRQPDVAAGAAYYQPDGDYDFHFRIARASRNERLVRALCGDLYHVMRVYRFRSSTRPGRARRAFAEHRAIVARCARATPMPPRRARASISASPGRARKRLSSSDAADHQTQAMIAQRDAMTVPGAANAMFARVIEDVGFP